MPTNGFSTKPLKIKLLAGEQTATKLLYVEIIRIYTFWILHMFVFKGVFLKVGVKGNQRKAIILGRNRYFDTQMPMAGFQRFLPLFPQTQTQQGLLVWGGGGGGRAMHHCLAHSRQAEAMFGTLWRNSLHFL